MFFLKSSELFRTGLRFCRHPQLLYFIPTLALHWALKFGLYLTLIFGAPSWAMASSPRSAVHGPSWSSQPDSSVISEVAPKSPVDASPAPAELATVQLSSPKIRQEPGFRTSADSSEFNQLCPTLHLKNLKALKLTPMEKRLLCGDGKADAIGTPWEQIPPDQAGFFGKSFLQSRGYHEPVLIQDREELFIDPGPQSRLTSFNISGGPEAWEPPRKRLIVGRPLTPKLLDELQGWTLGQIKNEGYACATATSEADPSSGENRGSDGKLNGGRTQAVLKPGKLKTILDIETIGAGNLNSAALDRYNAFRVGNLYRDYLVELTRRRTTDDGFLQSIVLTTRCEPAGVIIVRNVLLGTSREVRAAIGASTEQGAIAKFTLKQNRIGPQANQIQTSLTTSFLRPGINGKVPINSQDSTTSFQWYYTAGEARLYLEPSIIFSHEAIEAYDQRNITAKLMNGYGQESAGGKWVFQAGPVWLDSYLARGEGVGHTAVVYIESRANWLSHDFEYYNTSPRSGDYLNLSGLYTLANEGQHFSAQRLQAQGEKLWNLLKYDPPLLVLGVRFNVNSVFSVGRGEAKLLPKDFVTFAGGDGDLRGFGSAELPRGNIGALSAALGSFELRFGRVILSRADVFIFNDFGSLGGGNMQLALPIFMSPGLGARWESPIGVVRIYGAEGFAINEDPHQESFGKRFRFGFTYGQEF